MQFTTRGAKISFLKSQLEEYAKQSQASAIQLLNEKAVSFKSFWVNKKIFVENADLKLVNKIAALPEVTAVRELIMAQIVDPIDESDVLVDTLIDPKKSEWNIAKIEADWAWGIPGGNNGQGVLVGVIDSGVRPTHEALRNNYREDHGWLDTYVWEVTPRDSNGHGIILGSGGIGVAPGAQFIACRACSLFCPEESLILCAEFMMCPTDPTGNNANCSIGPTLVSNSWAGGQVPLWFDAVLDAWHIAGIIPVFAIGNHGPSCATARYPGESDKVIGVGSTTDADEISSFSSRGPSIDGIVKPDVVAPGTDIRSVFHVNDTTYTIKSGTSMATPHVTGTIALLLSHNPNLNFDEIKTLLQNNTDRRLGLADVCPDIPSDQFPNNVYGHGRINARRTLQAAINGFRIS